MYQFKYFNFPKIFEVGSLDPLNLWRYDPSTELLTNTTKHYKKHTVIVEAVAAINIYRLALILHTEK